jgi:hypothetical protein
MNTVFTQTDYKKKFPPKLVPIRLSYSAESAAIQQCFSLTTHQRILLSATINQRNEQAVYTTTLWVTLVRVFQGVLRSV